MSHSILERFQIAFTRAGEVRSKAPLSDKWPLPLADPSLSLEYGSSHLLQQLSRAREALPNADDYASAFGYPSRIAQLCYMFWSLPSDPHEGEDRRALLRHHVNAVSVMRHGDDLLDRLGPSLLLSVPTAGELGSVTSPPGDAYAQAVSRLSVALSSYVELLYFELLRFGVESHGPYASRPGRKIIVREFHDLHPPYWAFQSTISFKNVTVYREVPEESEIAFDHWGRLYAPHLDACRIWATVDDNLIGIDEANLALEEVSSAMKLGIEESLSIGGLGLLSKSISGRYWACRGLSQFADITPPSTLLDGVLDPTQPGWLRRQFIAWAKLPSPDSQRRAMMRLIDPGDMGKALVD